MEKGYESVLPRVKTRIVKCFSCVIRANKTAYARDMSMMYLCLLDSRNAHDIAIVSTPPQVFFHLANYEKFINCHVSKNAGSLSHFSPKTKNLIVM